MTETLKDKIARAKNKPVNFYSHTIKANEIEEGLELKIYPVKESEYASFETLWDKESLVIALMIFCLRDDDGAKLFSIKDKKFLDGLGHGFASKVCLPAIEMSGIGEDYSIKKK